MTIKSGVDIDVEADPDLPRVFSLTFDEAYQGDDTTVLGAFAWGLRFDPRVKWVYRSDREWLELTTWRPMNESAVRRFVNKKWRKFRWVVRT